MSYQALYRVYRPQRFEDIQGQGAINQTLKNAISENKTSHAYLFTGPRGTGKTSAAKIFSKAINCPNSKDGEPCNVCDLCRSITEGSLNDVIEIDAASNNGVEEIRDIREKANYAPTRARYKVYIIDEVHMLSQGAFNALLKTLEEPPAHVVFILATTEPHKIPLTIISRTQRFDFKRLTSQDIIDRMVFVLNEEQIEFEPEALEIISQAAEGGMRDALSILDQAISFSDKLVTEEVAMAVTGALTQQNLMEYMDALHERDADRALNLLQSILSEGKDPARFAEDVILFARDMIIYKGSQDSSSLLKRARVDEEFHALVEKVNNEELYQIIQILNDTQQELRQSNHAPVYLEVATVRLSRIEKFVSNAARSTSSTAVDSTELEALVEQVKQLQGQVQALKKSGLSAGPSEKKTNPTPKKSIPQGVSFTPNRTRIYEVLKNAQRTDLSNTQVLWPDLISGLTVTQRAMVKASQPVAASPEGIVISFEYDILCQRAQTDDELLDAMGDFLEKVQGIRPQLVFVTQAQWPEIRQDYIDQMHNSEELEETSSEIIQEAAAKNQEKSAAEEKIVDQAVELFGQDVVEIIEE